MIKFKVNELLKKHKMSRYKLRQYSGFTYERVNQFFFGTARSVKVEELEILCDIFNCNVGDIIEYKKWAIIIIIIFNDFIHVSQY